MVNAISKFIKWLLQIGDAYFDAADLSQWIFIGLIVIAFIICVIVGYKKNDKRVGDDDEKEDK